MSRQTIDIGIDLGTTNSAIAVVNRGVASVLKSPQQRDTTPSCVYFSRARQVCVGDEAWQRHRRDLAGGKPSRAHMEFKTRMGTDSTYGLVDSDTIFTPEQLSAEVLKVLRSYLRDEPVDSAVITVPAAFSQVQVEATQRAAELAGLAQVELLPEPLAASIAFSIDSRVADGYWLVFDLGGGTFDAVLMRMEEGLMRVVDIAGDNCLGGKDIDLSIAREVLLPALAGACPLTAALREPARRERICQLLKFLYAENAKIALSSQNSVRIELDEGVVQDDHGEGSPETVVTLTREEVARITTPMVDRALAICTDLLQRNHISADTLQTVLLVGGPTYMPCVRERLQRELCERIDHSIDPMSAVARGAALYAATVQRVAPQRTAPAGVVYVELACPRSTVEDTVTIGVKVLCQQAETMVQLTRTDGGWQSDRVALSSLGAVLLSVPLVPQTANTFDVALYAPNGDRITTEPDSCTIMHGVKIGNPPLPFDICVQVSTPKGDRLTPILRKGQTLPATGTVRGLKTKTVLRPGEARDVVSIPLFEGTRDTRPLHNRYLGELHITGAHVPSSVPQGSEVEVSVTMDTSRRKSVSVYFDAIDETVEEVMAPLQKEQFDPRAVPIGLEDARIRIAKLEERLPRSGNGRVAGFRLALEQVEDLQACAGEQRDGAEKVLQRVRELHRDLDNYEQAMSAEIECGFLRQQLAIIEPEVMSSGTPAERAEMAALSEQADAVIEAANEEQAKPLRIKAIALYHRVVDRKPEHWMWFVHRYRSDFGSMKWRNRERAAELLERAERLTRDGFVPEVKAIVEELWRQKHDSVDEICREDVLVVARG